MSQEFSPSDLLRRAFDIIKDQHRYERSETSREWLSDYITFLAVPPIENEWALVHGCREPPRPEWHSFVAPAMRRVLSEFVGKMADQPLLESIRAVLHTQLVSQRYPSWIVRVGEVHSDGALSIYAEPDNLIWTLVYAWDLGLREERTRCTEARHWSDWWFRRDEILEEHRRSGT